MTTFTVTGNWTGQGTVEGTAFFYPQPATAGSAQTATISAGELSTTLPVITGAYLVEFNNVTLNGVLGSINSFEFPSPASGTVNLNSIVSPPPSVITAEETSSTPPAILPASTAIASEFTLANSTAATPIVALTLGSGQLVAGSTFRTTIRGTVQTEATSGTLTFSPYVGPNVSAETFIMGTQSGANAAAPFWLVFDSTVQTTGSSGTYITNGYGRIEFGSPVGASPVLLTTTGASTSTVDTTQDTVVIEVEATWATANASNSLLVQTATIERIN